MAWSVSRICRRKFAIGVFVLVVAVGGMAKSDAFRSALGELDAWDDGLAEMCYYDATKDIYGKSRKYTRVHIFVRQWNDRVTGVKTSEINSDSAVPVFKFNIAEEIPTENYNYRFLTTLFQNRYTLAPLKIALSSQEWCGATFKHLRWQEDKLVAQQFSYFEREADTSTEAAADIWPFEASFAIVRELVASGTTPAIRAWLPPLRSSRQTALREITSWEIGKGKSERLVTPAGAFDAVPVSIRFDDELCRYWIDTKTPFRLLKFDGFGESFVLRGVEVRAYWDRNWSSKFHGVGEAP